MATSNRVSVSVKRTRTTRLLQLLPTVQNGEGFRNKKGDSTRQLEILCLLQIHGPMKMGEVATKLDVKRPTATKMVACLKRREFISSNPYERGRPVVVSITAKGREYLRNGQLARNILKVAS